MPSVATNDEVPLLSDSLADSIGVNAHTSTMYTASDYPTVVSLMQTLGVRHVRDAIIANEPGYDTGVAQLLGNTAKLDGLTDCAGIEYNSASPTSASTIQTFDQGIGNRIEDVEGPNEVDNRNDSNWVSDTLRCLPSLRAAIPSVPFLAPSLANPNVTATQLGNIASLVDYGNVHRYFSGHNPGSTGWGGTNSCGTYGALAWALCLSGVNAGSKPTMITETGYNSTTEVDEPTQAKYLSRAFLVNVAAGITRTYVYVLKDYSGDATFGSDGLIRSDDSTKPSYAAIENLISYFGDPGNSSAQTAFAFSLSNKNLDHVLFRKRDGSYVLALWNETASWNVSNETPIVVAPQMQTISLARAPQSVSAESLNDAGAFASAATTVAGDAISISIDDHVTVVRFTLP